MTNKTKGQLLYEHRHPSIIAVTPWEGRVFAKRPMYVPNPEVPTPYHLLTEECRQRYEQQAIGHYLFSGGDV